MASASDPKDFNEAHGIVEWDTTMEDEYHSLLKNCTWDLVPLPKGRKLVWCKWVYEPSMQVDGTIDKYKARLVAKGFSQVEGIDYSETFAPVAKMNSIHLVLSLVASRKWIVHQMDVKGAFLHGDYRKRYIWSNHLVLSRTLHLCANLKNPCMVSNKLLGLGMRRWIPFFSLKDFLIATVIQMSISCGKMMNFSSLFSMWMISFSLGVHLP
jgi:hypothetical protein